MGNTSRAAKGRGLTTTGQRVVARRKPVRARVVPARPKLRSRTSRGATERERALHHIVTSSHGRRSKNKGVMNLLAKIREAIQNLRDRRRG